jgi:ABC-type sugar transport system substrate-binding protein
MPAKVVLSLLSDQQEFQLMQAEAARESAARAGLELEALFADNNSVVQVHQLFRHIHAPEGARPRAIIVETVAGEGLERVARNATSAGIGWLLLNRAVGYLDALRQERSELPIASVSVDNLEVGRIQGRQLRALLPKGGRVLYLQGPADTSAAKERLAGAQKALESGGIELRVLNGDWTEEGAERTLNTWLRLKTTEGQAPVAVCAQNDAMAVGARRALLAHRPDWKGILFTGCDGLPNGGLRHVQTGELTATIVTPLPAGAAVTLVARAIAGERVAPELRLPPRSHPGEDELARRARSGAQGGRGGTR